MLTFGASFAIGCVPFSEEFGRTTVEPLKGRLEKSFFFFWRIKRGIVKDRKSYFLVSLDRASFLSVACSCSL